ncbi:hypothetical protein C9374_009091 [Naegleria lovaniensis]|uniref:Uncharacterized protein n=1 Tax=Naegleria lovaniensis TaxID=51637 RepID=A0AA88KF80_NAELO|nr:uncharacterized protein C9374_009091 [Naegleria lovaniensis]KAG2377575.1 hypothetical protein C9374_009091 [Naegleria lovaniensis]
MQKLLLDQPSHLNSVRNALEGLALIFPNQLELIKTTQRSDDQDSSSSTTVDTILLRKIHDNTKHVSLISGGGSGHSPSHESFVAKGMLTAAVCGAVFTSPSTSQIYRAIQAVTKTNKENGKGCLLIVKNYTGDILNFRLAREMALQNDYRVEMIVVGDDVTHQRGVAGTVFVHKLCGAMADNNYSLDEIVNVMKSFELMSPSSVDEIKFEKPFIRSIGVGLNSITLPGHQEPLYDLKDSDAVYELGLGIHGEKGVSRLEYPRENAALEISQTMILQLISLEHKSTNVSSDAKKCALMVNNLGSTTLLEMYNIVKIVVTILQQCNIVLERLYVGTFMTALNMHGVSLTLLNLGTSDHDKILELLDWKTDSLFWPECFKLSILDHDSKDSCRDVSYLTVDSFHEASMGTTDEVYHTTDRKIIEDFIKLLEIVCDHIDSRYQYYNELDSAVGDGDFGDSMKRAAKHIRTDILKTSKSINSLQALFYGIGTSIHKAGGSSGAIVSMFFLKYARSLRESPGDIDKRHVKAFQDGVQGMMELGDTKAGDKTLLDTLIPISEFLKELDIGHTLDNTHFSQNISEIANKAMLSTKEMLAKRGRARYLGDRVLGHVDPGAFFAFEVTELWAKWFSENRK